MTIQEIRQEFPHTERGIYLNHAATGPLSRRVVDAIGGYVEQRHYSHIDNYGEVLQVVGEAKRRLAKVLGTQPARVEFTTNTSSALHVLASGLTWREGDRIALPACEFPANVYPFLNLQRKGVEVDFIPHERGTFRLEDIERALTPRTRLLTLSWVQFLSGFRSDLEQVGALCRSRGVWFCVDAIQGLGALTVDVGSCGIDFLACGAQKWLMGLQGTGFLYVTEKLLEEITPVAGWLHGPIDWDDFLTYRLAFHPDASRFRLGTSNDVGLVALNAALGLYLEAGTGWCEAQVLARSRELAEGLRGLGMPQYGSADPAHASGIVTFEHEDPEGLFGHLRKRGITASLRNRLLRFSPTYYNSTDEVDVAVEAVAEYGRSMVAVRAPRGGRGPH